MKFICETNFWPRGPLCDGPVLKSAGLLLCGDAAICTATGESLAGAGSLNVRGDTGQALEIWCASHAFGWRKVSQMNWSRGLFRFWIIATALWGIMVFWIVWKDRPDIARGISRLTVICRYDASVNISDDEQAVTQAVIASAAAEQRKSFCGETDKVPGVPTQVDLDYLRDHPEAAENFRARFGALPGTGASTSTWPLSQTEVANALSSFREDQARQPAFVREILGTAVLFIAIPSAVVFALGWALLWAFSGFRAHRP